MLDKFFRVIIDNPIKVIIFTVLISLFVGISIVRLEVDPSAEAMILDDDPTKIEMENFKKQFGNDELIIIAFDAKNIFEPKILSFIKDLTIKLENLNHVKEVTSLYNANRVSGKGNTLDVGKFLDPMPIGNDEINQKFAEAVETPLYLGDIITKNSKATSIVVKLKTADEVKSEMAQISDEEMDEELDEELIAELNAEKSLAPEFDPRGYRLKLLSSIREVIKQNREIANNLGISQFHISGLPVTKSDMITNIKEDSMLFIPVVMGFILIMLFLAFRNRQGVLLPFLVVQMSLIVTMGAMGLAGIKVTVVNSMLPIVVMIISVADVIHILVKYYEELAVIEEKKQALLEAMKHIVIPCFLTSFTTIVGFMTLLYADIPPIKYYGLFASIGVAAAFIFAITTVPAFLSLMKKPSERNLDIIHGMWMSSILKKISGFNKRFKWPIFIVTIIVLIGSAGSIYYLNVETSFHKSFKDSSTLVKDLKYADEKLSGATPLEITVEAIGKDGKLSGEGTMDRMKNIRVLSQIDKLQKFLSKDPLVKKTNSLVDTVKEISKSMHIKDGKEDSSFYKLPKTTEEVANYLFLYNSSAKPGDLDDIVNSTYTKTRIAVRLTSSSSKSISEIVNKVRKFNETNFDKDLEVIVTGTSVLFSRMADNLVENQMISFAFAIVMIVGTMAFVFKSIKIGVFTILPNLFPILFNFLIMVFMNIDFNLNTAMISSIVIGLVVDDTIHFFSRLIFEMRKGHKHEVAIDNTIFSTGRAMGFTSIILAGGFAVAIFSNFRITQEFSILIAIVIIVALLADLVMVAVTVLIFKPNFVKSVNITFNDDNDIEGDLSYEKN